jgi:hypothetical protein
MRLSASRLAASRARALWLDCGLQTPAQARAADALQAVFPVRGVSSEDEETAAVLERIASAQRHQLIVKPPAPDWNAPSGRPLSASEREIARRNGWA